MLLCPDEPVIDNRAGEKDPNTTRDRGEHCKPPSPAVNTLHGRVKAHRPAPEKGCTLRGGAAIINLLKIAIAAETGHRQNGRPMHGEQQNRAIDEDNLQTMEVVIIKVAITD